MEEQYALRGCISGHLSGPYSKEKINEILRGVDTLLKYEIFKITPASLVDVPVTTLRKELA
jgi:hypothetical protein